LTYGLPSESAGSFQCTSAPAVYYSDAQTKEVIPIHLEGMTAIHKIQAHLCPSGSLFKQTTLVIGFQS